jgi:hypothetical protein
MNQDRKGERRYAVLHFGSNRNIKEKGGWEILRNVRANLKGLKYLRCETWFYWHWKTSKDFWARVHKVRATPRQGEFGCCV